MGLQWKKERKLSKTKGKREKTNGRKVKNRKDQCAETKEGLICIENATLQACTSTQTRVRSKESGWLVNG